MSQYIQIQTEQGPVQAEINESGAVVQLNVFMPPRGAGFFLAFPAGEAEAAKAAAADLLNGDPLEEGRNITADVPGALAAGTVMRPVFKAHFGRPNVAHARA